MLGYLPGYLTEEGYEDGCRFVFAVGVRARGVADARRRAACCSSRPSLVWRRTTPADPWLGQLVMIGVTLLAVSPRYPWYALLLVPFVALTGRWEWLAIPLALLVRQLQPAWPCSRSSLAAAVLVIVLVSIVRSGPGWLDRLADVVLDEGRRIRQLPGRVRELPSSVRRPRSTTAAAAER